MLRSLMTLAVVLTAVRSQAAIAFHYATPLSAHELEWYSRFEVLVTHDPLPREQVEALHRRGVRLALYEWAVAYYASLATPWHRSAPVLNRTPLRGHLGADDADAFYYDPASHEHQRGRADFIARRLKNVGYDGVFLDTTTSESVHPDALAEYRRRHPDVPYDEAYASFLANLRRSVALIITNQGYRRADNVLPYVDWDVSESLITRPVNGKYVFRPWNDPQDAWNSTSVLMRRLIEPARRKYPHVRFAHINYVDAADAASVAHIVAVTRLFDADAVVALPHLAKAVESPLMLLDLGKPGVRDGSVRFFGNGMVAFNPARKALRIPIKGNYVDAVSGKRVSGTLVVPPSAARILLRKR